MVLTITDHIIFIINIIIVPLVMVSNNEHIQDLLACL